MPKTVIYPGPNVGADPGPHFYSARLGVHLENGVPTEISDEAADALLAGGTVSLVPTRGPSPAAKAVDKPAAGAPLDKGGVAP